jgi:hypothetical protein
MPRPIDNLGALWYYLRKKQRMSAGRATVQLHGAQLVRGASPKLSPQPAAQAGMAPRTAATVATAAPPAAAPPAAKGKTPAK